MTHSNPFKIGDSVFIDTSKTSYDDGNKSRIIIAFTTGNREGNYAILEGFDKKVHIDCLSLSK